MIGDPGIWSGETFSPVGASTKRALRGGSAVLGLALLVTTCISVDFSSSDIEGVWRYDAFTVDGTTAPVMAGVNATQAPWAEIDEGAITGSAGCNEYAGTYEMAGEVLRSEIVVNAAWCGPEDGSLMEAELAFTRVVWADSPVVVAIEGGRMTWTSGEGRLVFVAVETPPTTTRPEPEPLSRIGRLDCSPGIAVETRVPDEGQTPLEIARAADPSVVSVEPGEPLWHSGLDAAGDVVVELALGDLPGADYQVWTCAG